MNVRRETIKTQYVYFVMWTLSTVAPVTTAGVHVVDSTTRTGRSRSDDLLFDHLKTPADHPQWFAYHYVAAVVLLLRVYVTSTNLLRGGSVDLGVD